MNFAALGEAVAERTRRYLARDWSRHTDPPILCPLMLEALARAAALGFSVTTVPDGLVPALRIGGFDADSGVHVHAIHVLLRHRDEAAELLAQFSAEPRPSGPSGEQ